MKNCYCLKEKGTVYTIVERVNIAVGKDSDLLRLQYIRGFGVYGKEQSHKLYTYRIFHGLGLDVIFIQQDKCFLSPSLKDSDYESFILHDVDLLPENDYNTYTCSTDHPKHGPSSSKLGTYHS